MLIKLLILILLLFTIGCNSQGYKVTQGYKSNELLLQLHNNERKNDLFLSQSLNEIAEVHAAKMASKGRLKHQSMNVLLNDGWSYVGENIAKNQNNEYEVVEAWMNSKGHRENIRNLGFTHVGFGFSINENNDKYWCACFGGE